MKKDIISLIKLLSITLDEAIIDIIVEDDIFNSIEWRRTTNEVILHQFKGNLDYEYNYEDLSNKTQRLIYLFLLRFTLN